ncbi:heterokaryon incompatibility protein-domain-containing protein [Xylaria intraflava]|nr:heterokaryon incompatibility protein-domain-containing protein [Xylaria intraflava]
MIPPEDFHSCHVCQKFVIDFKEQSSHPGSDEEDKRSDIILFDATLEDVLNGLTGGCELCLWLDSQWKGPYSSSREQYDSLKAGGDTSKLAVCAETFSESLHGRYPVDEIGLFGLWERDVALHSDWSKCPVFARFPIDVFTTQGDAASHFIQNRPINRFPGAPDSLGLARQWLQMCLTSHEKCRSASQSQYMPLRVLRIREGCDSCEFHVTLETTSKDVPIEPYAALSYCWGGDQPYKTTKVRLESDDLSLRWCKLPRSIQDAIKTTAALGLQCLWADSLCIVQDDDDDKALQIADMAHIYNEAIVTIIASRASRAVDGFLGEIDLTSQMRLAVRVPFRCPGGDGAIGSAYLVHIEGNRDGREPIDSRAWTLQERYLSNRVLQFGSRQTRWTCATTSAVPFPPAPASLSAAAISSDGYADGWKWDQNLGDDASRILYLHSNLLAELEELATLRSSVAWVRDWLYSRWQTILSSYTQRLLTVPTDRILGMSGVAEVFLAHMQNEGQDQNEEYLAGLWRSSLPALLCWHAVAAGKTQTPKGQGGGEEPRDVLPPSPKIYQGPSWSWTGVNCDISFILGRACEGDCRAVLLDTDIRLANAGAGCGAVTHAILKLKGRMRRSFWNTADGTLQLDPNEQPYEKEGVRIVGNIGARKMRLAMTYPDTSDFTANLPEERGLEIPVWLFEIGRCAGLKKRGPVGLILEPVNTAREENPPRFRRLGLFHVNTRQVPKAHQSASGSTENTDLEDEMNLFEGQVAEVIQIE